MKGEPEGLCIKAGGLGAYLEHCTGAANFFGTGYDCICYDIFFKNFFSNGYIHISARRMEIGRYAGFWDCIAFPDQKDGRKDRAYCILPGMK